MQRRRDTRRRRNEKKIENSTRICLGRRVCEHLKTQCTYVNANTPTVNVRTRYVRCTTDCTMYVRSMPARAYGLNSKRFIFFSFVAAFFFLSPLSICAFPSQLHILSNLYERERDIYK